MNSTILVGALDPYPQHIRKDMDLLGNPWFILIVLCFIGGFLKGLWEN